MNILRKHFEVPEEEEMEVTVATQLESLIVTVDSSDLSSNTQRESTAAALSLDSKDEEEMEVNAKTKQKELGETTDDVASSCSKQADAGEAASLAHVCRTEDCDHNELKDADRKDLQMTNLEEKDFTGTTQTESAAGPICDYADTLLSTQTPPEVGLYGVCRTDDFDSYDSEESDSPSAPVVDDDDDVGLNQSAPIKTRDEVLLEELPAVEEVAVSLPEDAELEPVGTVSSILQQLVVIQSLKDTPALTDESIIFTSDRLAVGKVFEVFGPVSSPLYILRFNSAEQISSKGLMEGLTLYYAPAIREYTGYILTQQLKLLKGSDASWKNDQEPPEEALDYSDDEKEHEAKRRVKNKRMRDNNSADNPNKDYQQQQKPRQLDFKGFLSRRPRSPFRQQHLRSRQPPFQPSTPPPRHTEMPPMYLPAPCPYPPPPAIHYPPPGFPLCPPPPFFNPSLSSPFWPPNSILFSDFPPPPPPPPQ
ncbi:H/ACA ribonucleoprotein complex non-core subunit NAF1 isoform X2 [Betta splendens]|uniref:H/ACA ribonucleoprotein complex non-core subunit NAF1 n=1 Tax=Betta splendens TaxID=158456 RepID=A0A6P7N7N6_BETSP|nr:H/ACA ribonucleoprotein complex non-core subunit NAF1 isoform X2 [Betta splendens]